MNRHLLIIAVATTALSSGALAADLGGPLSAPAPYVQAPVFTGFDWSGPYAGLNVGYGGGDQHYDYSVAADPLYFSGNDFQHNSGVVGGAQIGYNYAFGGSFIVGLETDFDGTSIGGSQVLDSPYVYARVGSHLNYFGTVRGRVGYTFDRAMFYATGGFAYGNISTAVDAPYDLIHDHATRMHTGYAVGAGFEFAVTNHISLRAEYLRLEFDDKVLSGGDPWMNYALHERPAENIVRVGLDYKFELFAPVAQPVIARY